LKRGSRRPENSIYARRNFSTRGKAKKKRTSGVSGSPEAKCRDILKKKGSKKEGGKEQS